MSERLPPPTPGGRVLILLWRAARIRNTGRVKRQRELMRRKKGTDSDSFSVLLAFGMIVLSSFVHVALAWMLVGSVEQAQILKWENQGKIVVPDYLGSRLEELGRADSELGKAKVDTKQSDPETDQSRVGREMAEENRESVIESLATSLDFKLKMSLGGTEDFQHERVVSHARLHGSKGFILESKAITGSLREPGKLPASVWSFAGIVILWWLLMLVFQGEGLDIDIQRRRHPLWEWLLSHPVRPAAAFSAEMLSPMMSNPIYFSAPMFWFVVLIKGHDFNAAAVGALLIGLPLAVVASCLNKSIEIAALLRLSSRRRGVFLGLISWAGYVGMLLPLFTIQAQSLKVALLKLATPLGNWPAVLWPWRALVAGWNASGGGWWQAALTGLALAVALLALAMALAWWGTSRGVQGTDANPVSVPKSAKNRSVISVVRDPFYRKELLWLWRDKGAVVQAILIPLTIGAMQAFNLRGLADLTSMNWSLVCGLGILCGTYFLLVLGPRSLTSEGGALWMALTWPQGLETLLKTKARLWWGFSMVVVGIVMTVAVVIFPRDWWRVLLVTAGWIVFSRALALKAVTLVTAPSSSGEPEPPVRGRQWAAMLGTLAFGAGVLTRSWHVAVLGVVFTSLTSVAMWQNLRTRLPYLFDRWSEKLPPAPSLMHAVIGIAVMAEVVGVVAALAGGMGGAKNYWMARAIGYGVVGIIAWGIMHHFLEGRGVSASEIWRWPERNWPIGSWMTHGGAVVAGALLAVLATLYLASLRWLPITSDYMEGLAKIQAGQMGGLAWQLILAVGFAPVAEEYFFRGLLFRALDREWGGWRAMVGSAAFFAVYHPPVSWVPVFALGILSALVFKGSGRLTASVALHMAYNLVLIGFDN